MLLVVPGRGGQLRQTYLELDAAFDEPDFGVMWFSKANRIVGPDQSKGVSDSKGFNFLKVPEERECN